MVLAPLAAGPVLGKVHAMKTMRRLIYTEVLTAVGFVTLAFLGLFFFFDFFNIYNLYFLFFFFDFFN
jgi:hypothetical protein